ncbi:MULTISPECIES: DUF11 domain-containing protein [Sphingomonadaceae]|uniref:DUF11 domain-containing protein n=1 Tax=Sphingomonadaceae TaxID=41297 RepID=UPI00115A0540|nr:MULTISPECIES: DUF11 domain-containing protein [Sphingomonadaceae]QDK32170.1 hypothetical protein DM450_05100 [Sphingomonas sp. IC081]QSR18921.1 hypothetical protein CA833_17285 [Novosphingobium sp. KA1]
MTRTSTLLGAASSLALVALGSSPAFATGTTAGATIQNTVTVGYQVGGVAQTAKTASDTFTVDRKVNVSVTEVGSAATVVSPGQVQAVSTFKVTNLSNDTLDFALTAAQLSGGSAAWGGSDNFDGANVKIYLDNGDGVFTSADTQVTYLDELAADAARTVFVVMDIPSTQVTGDIASVVLTATAKAGGTSGSQGAALTTSSTNTSGVDTVLADGAGASDAANDGAFSAKDDFKVSAAALSVLKTSRVVSDPVSGTSNPKAIPGATIEYCISVANATGSAVATNIAVNDPLPANVTYVASSILLNGTVTGSTCNADGTSGGTFASNTVTGTLADIAAGVTRTLVFRATIN